MTGGEVRQRGQAVVFLLGAPMFRSERFQRIVKRLGGRGLRRRTDARHRQELPGERGDENHA